MTPARTYPRPPLRADPLSSPRGAGRARLSHSPQTALRRPSSRCLATEPLPQTSMFSPSHWSAGLVLKALKARSGKVLLIVVPLLLTSALAGGFVLIRADQPESRTLLPPFEFQLNGRDPYTIRLQLATGEGMTCFANASMAPVTLVLAFHGLVLSTSTFVGRYQTSLQAPSTGSYVLEFVASSPALVWVGVSST